MATKPFRMENEGAHSFLEHFIANLLKYQENIDQSLQIEEDIQKRTVTALILKGCFLKLAHEKKFLSVSSPVMFKSLLSVRKKRVIQSDQIDIFAENYTNSAVDSLLEDIDLDPKLFKTEHVKKLYDLLIGVRLEILDNDILGTVYQALTMRGDRKKMGQFYTPPAIVNAIIEKLEIDLDKKPDFSILDPACGSGHFLLGAYDTIKATLEKSGLSSTEAHKQAIEKHLYGFDVDPFAITLTKMNLLLKERITEPLIFNINLTDTLECRNPCLMSAGPVREEFLARFDAVVGNPPWGSQMSKSDKQAFKKMYKCAKSGVNSFTLFLERAMDLTKPGGSIGFLIPEAYLNIRAHRQSRKELLKKTAIKYIATCGELFKNVFAPSIILLGKIEHDSAIKESNVIDICKDLGGKYEESTKANQIDFWHTPENIINIYLDNQTRKLLGQISENAATLKGHASFGLGLVTGDNERLIANSKSSERHEPLIVGKDLSPYCIHFSDHWIVYDRDELQQACPRSIFDANEKLLYRFIGKRLVFALDNEGRFTLNNANVLVPHLPGFRIKYILALLNSELLQFYYTFSFFTVKVLRGNLERLPLRWVEMGQQKRIENMVDSLDSTDELSFKRTVRQINDVIFDIYGISPDEVLYIKDKLKEELRTKKRKKKGK